MAPDDGRAVEAIGRLTANEIDASSEIGRSFSRIWVARVDPGSEPTSFLLAWKVADELHVINLATHPEMRRRGHARALLHAALEYAKREHLRLVLLEVRRGNRPAIELYRAAGFRAMGVRGRYYADGEDALEMMLALDPVTGRIQPGRDELAMPEA